MKSILFLSIILTWMTGHAQMSADTIVISDYQKLKQIPTCIGVNCLSGESCSVGVPQGSTAKYFLHKDVRIGKIRHSRMVCELPEGICTRMVIDLKDAESVEQAGKQAAKQFGDPVYTKEGDSYVYTWKQTNPDQQALRIRLEVAADQKHGMLYVEAQM